MKSLLTVLIPVFLGFTMNLVANPIEGIQSPDPDKKSIKEIPDLPYYESEKPGFEKAKLNIILPEGVENPPVLMWIGGGAWAYVDRNVEMNLCREMAKQGICVISVGHRLSPALIWEPKNEEGIQHPEHVKDIAQAFKWVRENSAEYGYDAENIFVGGFSSGAHLSTLLAMDNRYLQNLGLSNSLIKGIIPVGGGYDIPHYKVELIKEDPAYEQNHINPVFGSTHESQWDASPVKYIDSLITPILMISENSTYVYSKVFEELLIEKGFADFQVINVHNKNHSELWRELSKPGENLYRNFIIDFIKQRSGKQ